MLLLETLVVFMIILLVNYKTQNATDPPAGIHLVERFRGKSFYLHGSIPFAEQVEVVSAGDERRSA